MQNFATYHFFRFQVDAGRSPGILQSTSIMVDEAHSSVIDVNNGLLKCCF